MQALRQRKGADKGPQALHMQEMLQGDGKGAWLQEVWLIFMVDRIADAINKIKTHERIGRQECTLSSTKFIRALLDVMKKESYIGNYEEFVDGKIKKVRVTLSNKINNIGVIKPRYAISSKEIQSWETRFIPSRDFGILIISTSQGLLTNKEAKEKNIGGRLVAYVY